MRIPRRFNQLQLGKLLVIIGFISGMMVPAAWGQVPNPLRDSGPTPAAVNGSSTPAATRPQPAKAETAETTEPQKLNSELVVEDDVEVEDSAREPLRFPVRSATFLGPQEPRVLQPQHSHSQVDYGRSVLRQQEQSVPQATPMLPQPEPETIVDGPIQFETDQMMADPGCCGGGGCVQCWLPCPPLRLDNIEFYTGVQGFVGPPNRGESGSFGFHQGVNWGAQMPCSRLGLGIQFGFEAVQSSLSGAEFTDQTRKQVFVTGGIFRRVDYGFQAGVVIDYRYDEWYAETDLTQVRGEVSWVNCAHEIGFWFTSSTKTDTQTSTLLNNLGNPTTTDETWGVTDLYAFFYRRQIDDCGTAGRFFAGWTQYRDALIGSDLTVPLTERFALQTEFTYLIPRERRGVEAGHEHEGWNVGFSLVWYPGCRTARNKDYYRPLLPVANNGSFMIEQF